MATHHYVDNGQDDGAILGRDTGKIGFYGTTPAAQPSTIATVTTTSADSTTNAYGYTTSTQADAIVKALNSVITALITLGLIAAE